MTVAWLSVLPAGCTAQLKDARSGAVEPSDPLAGLPLIEVPAAQPSLDYLALYISGDGGWSVTERKLSAALAGQGVAVIGWDALRYFWSARTPEETASDAARILRRYTSTWGKQRILLIGYSYGADVLPFIAARLPADLQSRVEVVALLGIAERADFKFHLVNWLGRSSAAALPTRPELDKLCGLKILCFYGKHDQSAICDELPPELVTSIEMEGGHLIGARVESIAAALLHAVGCETMNAGGRPAATH